MPQSGGEGVGHWMGVLGSALPPAHHPGFRLFGGTQAGSPRRDGTLCAWVGGAPQTLGTALGGGSSPSSSVLAICWAFFFSCRSFLSRLPPSALLGAGPSRQRRCERGRRHGLAVIPSADCRSDEKSRDEQKARVTRATLAGRIRMPPAPTLCMIVTSEHFNTF